MGVLASGWQWEWKLFKQCFKMWGRRTPRTFLVIFGGLKKGREREREGARERERESSLVHSYCGIDV